MSEKNDNFLKMLEENEYLVSIETVKIKDFIFNTNKLKLIRGASYLLDYLNQVEVPRIISNNLKNSGKHSKLGFFEIDEIKKESYEKFYRKLDEEIDEKVDERIIYIGAGNAKFFVNGKETAEKICKEVKEVYTKMAPGAKVTAEYKKIEKDELVWDVIDELAREVGKAKSKGFSIVNLDVPFAKKM
ncbi:MAG: hypothetical protein HXM47_05265 [Pseudoleptotrichia goodfellowii]|nr:hypothetical protein [Pseudoleptotrichia goodfellowii]